MTNNEKITDAQILDLIAEALREPEWSPETLDEIANIVSWSGRDISPNSEEDSE